MSGMCAIGREEKSSSKTAPLPKFRLSYNAFIYLGIDFPGPVFVRNIYGNRNKKRIKHIYCYKHVTAHMEYH